MARGSADGGEMAVGRGYVAGMRVVLPFGVMVASVGVSFGAMARSLGWGVVVPIAFSLLALSRSAQSAVVAVLGAGGGDLVGDVERWGLDVDFPAFFLEPFISELKGGRRALAVAATAAAPYFSAVGSCHPVRRCWLWRSGPPLLISGRPRVRRRCQRGVAAR